MKVRTATAIFLSLIFLVLFGITAFFLILEIKNLVITYQNFNLNTTSSLIKGIITKEKEKGSTLKSAGYKELNENYGDVRLQVTIFSSLYKEIIGKGLYDIFFIVDTNGEIIAHSLYPYVPKIDTSKKLSTIKIGEQRYYLYTVPLEGIGTLYLGSKKSLLMLMLEGIFKTLSGVILIFFIISLLTVLLLERVVVKRVTDMQTVLEYYSGLKWIDINILVKPLVNIAKIPFKEFGNLVKTFGDLAEKMKNGFSTLKFESAKVIINIRQSISQSESIITETNNTVKEVTESVKFVSSLGSILKRIVGNLEENREKVKVVEESFEKFTGDIAQVGQSMSDFNKFLLDFLPSMEKLITSFEEVSKSTEIASAKSKAIEKTLKTALEQIGEIEKITKVVLDINESVDILSINASIESARAGEYGKGFAVVSKEMRQLALNTKSEVEKIKERIREFLSNATTVFSAIDDINKIIKEFLEKVSEFKAFSDQVKSSFSTISQNSKANIENIQTIMEKLKEVKTYLTSIREYMEDVWMTLTSQEKEVASFENILEGISRELEVAVTNLYFIFNLISSISNSVNKFLGLLKLYRVDEGKELLPEEVIEGVRSGEMVVIDIRPKNVREEKPARIPTISLDSVSLETLYDYITKNGLENKKVALLCITGLTSYYYCKLLCEKGLKNIYTVFGGAELLDAYIPMV